ncbi:MAG: hypothetical protein MJZ85_08930 [Bacteroidales bacterium]|nr:hypothetical protein [Bacteroidales bacterium]
MMSVCRFIISLDLKGVQQYKCLNCGRRSGSESKPSEEEIWSLYQNGKQTIAELADLFGTSESSIKRRLRTIRQDWAQPVLSGSGFVHLDATYLGHNWGVMLAVDSASGFPLYMSLIKHETVADYRTAVGSIRFYMPYLFTFQHTGCEGMPNTNNKIEGIFTDLKKNLNNHSGMSVENRKRFINGFFLALEGRPVCQKERPSP